MRKNIKRSPVIKSLRSTYGGLSSPSGAIHRDEEENTKKAQESKPPIAGVRLNKALAMAGVASRRAADDLIRAGRVQVNGEIVTDMGRRILPEHDSLSLDGTLVNVAGLKKKFTYILLHKPTMVVSTVRDPEGRTTVLDCLPPEYADKRLFPVGRLDYFSEGLLLLTDDGELTMRLTHPRYHLAKLYYVKTREAPAHEALQTMRRGMRLAEGEMLAPVDVELLGQEDSAMLLTLRQGVNRQIRRMCRDLGLTILTLRRLKTGPIELGDLPKGKSRLLYPQELCALKKSVGL